MDNLQQIEFSVSLSVSHRCTKKHLSYSKIYMLTIKQSFLKITNLKTNVEADNDVGWITYMHSE